MGLLNRKKAQLILIIGCGRLGASLADALSNNGKDVIVIDQDPTSFRKLSPLFGGIMVTGDCSDLSVLEEAQISQAQSVVAVTNNDNINIMIAQIAKEIYGVKHVISRLYDPEREVIYAELGIETICPSSLSVAELEKMLNLDLKGEQS